MFGISGIPYVKIAALFAALGAGAYLMYAVYARPEIVYQKTQIANMKAASEKNLADFEAAARAKQQEYDNAKAQSDAAYESLRAAKDADLARTIAAGVGLQHTVDAYVSADQRRRLSDQTLAACRADDTAATLGQLLDRALDLSTRRTADAERLADQLRALQAYEVRN